MKDIQTEDSALIEATLESFKRGIVTGYTNGTFQMDMQLEQKQQQ